MPDTNSRFLYFIGGSKGGVGKSILSMILADSYSIQTKKNYSR